MPFNPIPTERTTAATDVLLCLLALACVGYLLRVGRPLDRHKTAIWAWALGLLAIAAALGAVAHGFAMSDRLNELLWQPLNLALGLTVALFAVGVIYDLWGPAAARRALPILLLAGAAFYVATRLLPGGFLVFVVYEAVVMLFSLAAYVFLAVRRRSPGAWWMAGGILVTIIAAGIQASGAVRVTLIWEFNHDGMFHLVQMIGLPLLVRGIRSGLLAR